MKYFFSVTRLLKEFYKFTTSMHLFHSFICNLSFSFKFHQISWWWNKNSSSIRSKFWTKTTTITTISRKIIKRARNLHQMNINDLKKNFWHQKTLLEAITNLNKWFSALNTHVDLVKMEFIYDQTQWINEFEVDCCENLLTQLVFTCYELIWHIFLLFWDSGNLVWN